MTDFVETRLEELRQQAIAGDSLDTQAFDAGLLVAYMAHVKDMPPAVIAFWAGVLYAWRHHNGVR